MKSATPYGPWNEHRQADHLSCASSLVRPHYSQPHQSQKYREAKNDSVGCVESRSSAWLLGTMLDPPQIWSSSLIWQCATLFDTTLLYQCFFQHISDCFALEFPKHVEFIKLTIYCIGSIFYAQIKFIPNRYIHFTAFKSQEIYFISSKEII